MAIYGKTTKQMVVDLINEGNPQLPFPINETDFEFGIPEVITDPGNGHNTRIRVIAKPNTNYIGNVMVTYRRLDVGRVFRNMTLHVQQWVPNSGMYSGNLIQLRTILPLYSEKYGFNFNPNEWADVSLNGYHGVRGDVFNITPLTTNLAFVGYVPAKWEIGERTLESLLPVDQVSGRLYPEGNDFSAPETRKYWVMPDSHHIDFSAYKDVLENGYLTAYGPLGTWYNGSLTAIHNSFFDNVVAQCIPRDNPLFFGYVGKSQGISNSVIHPDYYYKDKPGGLNGIQAVKITLPHASYPEANSEFFNRAIVIQMPADCPWGTGRMFFHYNV